MIPPRWDYNDEQVPNIALRCKVLTECRLDLSELVETYTDVYNISAEFVHLDLIFVCSNNKDKFGKHRQILTKVVVQA